jgi:L-asparaginase
VQNYDSIGEAPSFEERGFPNFVPEETIRDNLMRGKGRVLVIYTGGTVGMLHKDPSDCCSPLVPANWSRIRKHLSELDAIPVEIEILEMSPIDSSDMEPRYWVKIAKAIQRAYNDVEGFVVLHGTDTMAHTASALSFLLKNLGKPVIVTGSQIPLATAGTDAVDNILGAIKLACPKSFNLPLVPEVCIYFEQMLLRGNRTRKVNSGAQPVFSSPNFPQLGFLGKENWFEERLIRANNGKTLSAGEKMDEGVAIIELNPGAPLDILESILRSPSVNGVVLKTYGAGNAPSSRKFLGVIERAVKERAIIIVNVTQCMTGFVNMSRYETGAGLRELGVVGGADMTPETACVKLQYLLGAGYPLEEIRKLLAEDMRGELTVH